MYFVNRHRSSALLTLFAASFVPFVCNAALAQGMMEYGGLMAMPKGVPSGDTVKNMTRGFGAIPNAMPGQTPASATAGITTTMPDGSIVVDQKKAAVLAAKADNEYKQAKVILGNKAALNTVNLKKAEVLLRDAISIRNNIWGYADPTIPQLLNILGDVYEQLKQPATAESCYQRALVYINKKHGTGSAERLETFCKLAPLLAKQNKLADALSIYQQIAIMKERKNGASDPAAIEARLTWADTAKTLDKPNAPDIYKQLIANIDAGTKLSPDKSAKYRGEAVTNYLELLKKQGREEEAKEAEATLTSATPAAAAKPEGESAPAATPTPTETPAAPAATPAAAPTETK